MKKNRKNKQSLSAGLPALQNPVAKYAHQFNKAQVFKDKTKYQRKVKHKGSEPFAINSLKDLLQKTLKLWHPSCLGLYFNFDCDNFMSCRATPSPTKKLSTMKEMTTFLSMGYIIFSLSLKNR